MAEPKGRRKWARVLWIVLALGLIAGAVLFTLVYRASKAEYPERRADAIVVLGARVKPDGELSLTLKRRIEAGYEAYEKGLADKLIVCGAQGSDEPMTEARAMADYLIGRGVSPDDIYLEDRSTDTYENLKNAKAIMDEQGMESALVVTSDYHITRALWLCADAGVDAGAYPSPGPAYLKDRVWSWVKESLSWVKYFAQYRLFK